VHPADASKPVFSRDLLEVEILDSHRRRKLLTVYNTHLKSHFVPLRPGSSRGREGQQPSAPRTLRRPHLPR